MALFNESLEGRFGRRVGSLHSHKGHNPVPQIAPEIIHSIPLADDFELFSHLFLEGATRYASGLFTLAADATHFGAIDFSLSASAGVLVILEQVWLLGQVGLQVYDVRINAAAVPPGSTGNGVPLDTREGSVKKSALLITANNLSFVGKSGSQVATLQVPANTDQQIPELAGTVISPGGHVTVFTNVINNLIQLRSAIWRERAANPAELRTA